ncbi:g12489 [Coccomyxa viridis]|uniref:G12489 protein n=1 Tax=Coccomyxa viridis TaxID=1274662 RepID=A0ABP1GAG7_9CHLO
MGRFKDDYRVLEIGPKGSKGRALERQKLLEKVAMQVQPVMRKHRWTVQMLSELPPTSTGRLWGLNVGGGGGRSSEIKIRLIEFGSKEQYLPYEAIIGTMLHELCHNEIGPHNALFYQLLDKITLELEEYMAKGITGTGEGFDAPSVGRLGGSGLGAHNPSPTELRSKIVQAAEARAKRAGLMLSGPRKLGGSVTGLTPREAAAAAAERRARDDAGCACGAKGGTSFTEAEVIELESQPGSAAAQQALGTEEPGVQQPAHAEQSRAGASSMQGQSCVALEATPQQQGELLYGRKHQQTAVNGKRKQSREAADMRELIDLTADSDDDVTD